MKQRNMTYEVEIRDPNQGTLEIVAADNAFKDKDPDSAGPEHVHLHHRFTDKSATGGATMGDLGAADGQSDTSGDVTDTEMASDTKGLVSNEPQMSDQRKIFLICLICFPQFIGAVQFSMIGSFYPQTAKSRGAGSLVIGMVVGFLELGVVLAAPLMGYLISRTGIRVMYVTGIIAYSIFGFVFGCLEFIRDDNTFLVICMITRLFMGFATAAFFTATYALAVHFFPNRLASVTGLLKICGGFGLVIGPLVGGYLFKLGGFILPFSFTQGILFLFGLVVTWILPQVEKAGPGTSRNVCQGHLMMMLKVPVLVICASFQITVNLVLSSADTCLALFLSQFHLDPVQIGLVFLAAPGCYILTTPLWGYISDKKPATSPFIIIINMTLAAVALFWMGPSPLLHIKSTLVILVVGLMCYGLASSATNVAIALMFRTASFIKFQGSREHGFPDNTEVNGIISSVVTCCASIGSLSGALISGLFYDKFHFGWLSTGYCFMYLTQVSVFVAIIIVQKYSYRQHNPEQPASPYLVMEMRADHDDQ